MARVVLAGPPRAPRRSRRLPGPGSRCGPRSGATSPSTRWPWSSARSSAGRPRSTIPPGGSAISPPAGSARAGPRRSPTTPSACCGCCGSRTSSTSPSSRRRKRWRGRRRPALASVSAERVRDELTHILRLPRSAPAIRQADAWSDPSRGLARDRGDARGDPVASPSLHRVGAFAPRARGRATRCSPISGFWRRTTRGSRRPSRSRWAAASRGARSGSWPCSSTTWPSRRRGASTPTGARDSSATTGSAPSASSASAARLRWPGRGDRRPGAARPPPPPADAPRDAGRDHPARALSLPPRRGRGGARPRLPDHRRRGGHGRPRARRVYRGADPAGCWSRSWPARRPRRAKRPRRPRCAATTSWRARALARAAGREVLRRAREAQALGVIGTHDEALAWLRRQAAEADASGVDDRAGDGPPP